MSSERRLSDLRQLVSGLYSLGETIGTGHYAVVKLARHVFTEKEVAVKVIDKIKLDEISKAHLFQEVKCMKLVQHPNVVRLYEVIDTPNKLYLILEFADGGDMYDYIMKHINGLNESLARKYFQQICRALKYCHEMHVCHRDLKPENLVFFEKQGVVKLTDFGFSNKFCPGKKLLTSCGSLAYSAPEILLGDPYDAPAVDIWSLGVILFMLVTGRAPFQEANDSETVMMILDCSYKLPPNISYECQNLIHRMIVRDPEKRATLDEVMSDIWYRQTEDDDDEEEEDNDDNDDLLKLISKDDHELILQQMINGNIAEQDIILKALNENQYNHITATYYLLADKIIHDDQQRTMKQKRRFLQPTTDPFTEQIGVFISSASNFNFADVSLPITRENSIDDLSDKENIPLILPSPRHSIDSSNEQVLSDEEERPSLQQQRTTNTQSMKIILEEDEYPESSSTHKTDTILQQLNNHPKLNKIVESEDEDEKSAISNTVDNSTSILRSKDLRSVIETKRRNFSRSGSSSDSEDNGSNHDMNRLINRKITRSPNLFHETELFINNRGRSFSNIEHILHEIPSNIISQQIISSTTSDNIKRKSFSSRTSSLVSANRLILNNNINDENLMDVSGTNSLTLINDRTRSLSNEHRLANPSQISIGSRTSIRYSTPRESTVFTKTDAPPVVRLLQQTHHHHQDPTDIVKTLIEHQRLQSIIHQDNIQNAIIVEEDSSPLLLSISNTNLRSSFGKKTNKSNVIAPTIDNINIGNGHLSSNSKLSSLKYSIIKHRKSTNIKEKRKCSTNRHRSCCVIQ